MSIASALSPPPAVRWGSGKLPKLAAYLLAAYWLFDALVGTDRFERFYRQWWLSIPIAVLLLLARYAPRLSRKTAVFAEVVSVVPSVCFVVAGLMGAFRFRYHDWVVRVVSFRDLATVPAELQDSCAPATSCLLINESPMIAECYPRWGTLPLDPNVQSVKVRIRVSYGYFDARGIRVTKVRAADEWHPVPALPGCYRRGTSIQVLTELFPYWRL